MGVIIFILLNNYLDFNLHKFDFRHVAAVRQLSNGTNGDDHLYIRIATVGNTIQTVNSPMYEYIHEYSW